MHLSDYESHLSTSQISSSSIGEKTLESLGQSTDSFEVKEEERKIKLPKRAEMTENGFNKLKARLMKKTPLIQRRMRAEGFNKKKLLGIICIALLMISSEIQLCDLLRFIREGSLSYSHVSHFLPKEFKISSKDHCYLGTRTESDMPTHGEMSCHIFEILSFLGITRLPRPDIPMLIRRYASELLLPEELGDLAVRFYQKTSDGKSEDAKTVFNLGICYEANAIAHVLVACKILFGLDGVTEYKVSQYAELLNSTFNLNMFVFTKWQNQIELRKNVLCIYHSPTREQLRIQGLLDVKPDLRLYEEHYTESKRNRVSVKQFKSDSKISCQNSVERSIESILTASNNFFGPYFVSVLTPFQSHMQSIIRFVKEHEELEPCWVKIAEENFTKTDISFITKPNEYSKRLNELDVDCKKVPRTELIRGLHRQSVWDDEDLGIRMNSNNFLKNSYRVEVSERKREPKKFSKNRHSSVLFNAEKFDDLVDVTGDFSGYWRLDPDVQMNFKVFNGNFQELFMERFPENFGWLLKECGLMLHLPVAKIYKEVIGLENKLLGM